MTEDGGRDQPPTRLERARRRAAARVQARAPRLYAFRRLGGVTLRVVVLPALTGLLLVALSLPDLLPDVDLALPDVSVPRLDAPGWIFTVLDVIFRAIPFIVALVYAVRELRERRGQDEEDRRVRRRGGA